ncbi:MAG TPA: hypothetical protein ENK57_17975 [Polyangiaceae bacterium]|nr:hypothetical protein [Polyangiaceae bacterium]
MRLTSGEDEERVVFVAPAGGGVRVDLDGTTGRRDDGTTGRRDDGARRDDGTTGRRDDGAPGRRLRRWAACSSGKAWVTWSSSSGEGAARS